MTDKPEITTGQMRTALNICVRSIKKQGWYGPMFPPEAVEIFQSIRSRLADYDLLKAEVDMLGKCVKVASDTCAAAIDDFHQERIRAEKAEAELEQARCRAAVVDACKDTVFIQHIQEHLSPGCEVVCKICGKTAREIIRAAKEK